jgi:hypothetical protein
MASAPLGGARKASEETSKEKTELAPASLETFSLLKNALQSITYVKLAKLSKEIKTVPQSLSSTGEKACLPETTAMETPPVLMESTAESLIIITDALDEPREPPVKMINNATQECTVTTLGQAELINAPQS